MGKKFIRKESVPKSKGKIKWYWYIIGGFTFLYVIGLIVGNDKESKTVNKGSDGLANIPKSAEIFKESFRKAIDSELPNYLTLRDSAINGLDRIPADSEAQRNEFINKTRLLFESEVNNWLKNKKEIAKKDSIEREQKLASLKSKFIYTKDDFQDIGFYSHKRWGKNWLNRKGVTVGLNSSGFIYLKSNYYSGDWLFHESITVNIDGQNYESEVVPRYAEENRTDISGGNIWEVITYKNSQSIIKAIAENTDKVIKVRFNGDKFYDDITLSGGDKNATRECWELSQLLK